MGQVIDEKAKDEVQSMLDKLTAPVKLVYFRQKHACPACREQQQILKTLAGLSDKVSVEVYDLVADAKLAREYLVDKVPATAIVGDKDYGIRFFGITGGYEFSSLLEGVLMVSRGSAGLDADLERYPFSL